MCVCENECVFGYFFSFFLHLSLCRLLNRNLNSLNTESSSPRVKYCSMTRLIQYICILSKTISISIMNWIYKLWLVFDTWRSTIQENQHTTRHEKINKPVIVIKEKKTYFLPSFGERTKKKIKTHIHTIIILWTVLKYAFIFVWVIEKPSQKSYMP